MFASSIHFDSSLTALDNPGHECFTSFISDTTLLLYLFCISLYIFFVCFLIIYNPLVRFIWGTEGHNLFYVFVESLGHFGNYMGLINIEDNYGEVKFDCTSYEVLYFKLLLEWNILS